MSNIALLPREKQEEAVWLTAYICALEKADPARAEVMAIDALRRFRSRWIGISTPEGIDPRVYAASRRAGEQIHADFESSLAMADEQATD